MTARQDEVEELWELLASLRKERDEALAVLEELANSVTMYPDFLRLVHAKAEARRLLGKERS